MRCKPQAKQHRPLLLDFHAVWCYSCYYMASHVLTVADWAAVGRKSHRRRVDADSPEGQAWMDKLKISFLPSYVVLDEHGNELGRISAEQPRAEVLSTYQRHTGERQYARCVQSQSAGWFA